MRSQQLAASQRMVERLHCAHAALGVRAEELDQRAERAAAQALRLSQRAAEQPSAHVRAGGWEDAGDGRAQLELARRTLLGGQRTAPRPAAEPQPQSEGEGVRESSVRGYVRTLDAAIAVWPGARAREPPADADAPQRQGRALGTATSGEWADGELGLGVDDDGYDDDDDGATMPVPYFGAL